MVCPVIERLKVIYVKRGLPDNYVYSAPFHMHKVPVLRAVKMTRAIRKSDYRHSTKYHGIKQ